jgi:hypothetical protein
MHSRSYRVSFRVNDRGVWRLRDLRLQSVINLGYGWFYMTGDGETIAVEPDRVVVRRDVYADIRFGNYYGGRELPFFGKVLPYSLKDTHDWGGR